MRLSSAYTMHDFFVMAFKPLKSEANLDGSG
jgi:hypothetical protein